MSEEQNHPLWQAESTHPQLAETVKKALRQVRDPEIGLDVVELGLIREVVIEDHQATITMILTTPFCPYAPTMMESARKRAEIALGRPTTIEFGMEMWDPSMMEAGAGASWGLF